MARYLQGAKGHPRGRAADAPPPDSPGNRSLGHLELAPWQHVNRHPVEERQRRVINRLLDGFAGFLTTSKYAAIATCSTDTALRDIGDLVSRGTEYVNTFETEVTRILCSERAGERRAGQGREARGGRTLGFA